jgi:large subunit ribosomal protein L24
VALKVKKNDTVKVISGKAKGKTGRVLHVLADDLRVVVEGVNFSKKHQKPSQRDQKGGIVDKESPIHVSNLMLVSPKSGQPVRVARREVDGKRARVEKKTGKAID